MHAIISFLLKPIPYRNSTFVTPCIYSNTGKTSKLRMIPPRQH